MWHQIGNWWRNFLQIVDDRDFFFFPKIILIYTNSVHAAVYVELYIPMTYFFDTMNIGAAHHLTFLYSFQSTGLLDVARNNQVLKCLWCKFFRQKNLPSIHVLVGFRCKIAFVFHVFGLHVSVHIYDVCWCDICVLTGKTLCNFQQFVNIIRCVREILDIMLDAPCAVITPAADLWRRISIPSIISWN